MRDYNSILYWENKKRIQALESFRSDLVEYYNKSKYDLIAGVRATNNKDGNSISKRISEHKNIINSYVTKAGVSPYVTKYPAPAVGGYPLTINLINEAFKLSPLFVSESNLFDVIDQAIGVYKHNKISSIINIFNPFFYIRLIINSISDFLVTPIKLLFPKINVKPFKFILSCVQWIFYLYQAYLWWGSDLFRVFSRIF